MNEYDNRTIMTEAIHEMMTVPELARYLRISRPTAYPLVKEGRIPSARFCRQIPVYRGCVIRMCRGAEK